MVIIALALVVAGAASQSWSGFSPLRAKLQKRDFSVETEDFTKLHALLYDQGSLQIRRDRPLSSTASAALAARDGQPTISIVTGEEGLHSPDIGIIPNALEKGRRWEREASISYFENGELRYETPAGLRIHGGTSRKERIKSFSIVFRRTYSGSPRAQPGVFFEGQSRAVQRIVLSNTGHVKRFLNPLALEIAARVGCETSRSQPARVVLNGEVIPTGYFLLEHQSREFLRHHFGHDDFDWYRLKGRSRPILSLDLLSSWIKSPPDVVTMEAAAQRYDLEDLCSWIFAMTFCATGDTDQGGYFKSRRDDEDVWHSLVWDMDGSFHHGKSNAPQTFDFDRLRGLRARLFRRLCETDPAFRAHYQKFAERQLAEAVSPAAIRALVDKYRGIAGADIFARDRWEILPALDETERFLIARRGLYLEGLRRFYEDVSSRISTAE